LPDATTKEHQSIEFMNLFCLVSSLAAVTWAAFFYLTVINLTVTTVYLTAIMYLEFASIRSLEVSQKAVEFWKDHYFKYAFVLSELVFCLFWGLVLLGDNFMTWPHSILSKLITIYVHGIICMLMLLEVFITPHKYNESHKTRDLVIIVVCLVSYILIQIVATEVVKYIIYPYLKWISGMQLTVMNLLITWLTLNLYQFYIYLLKYKNQNQNQNQTPLNTNLDSYQISI